MFRDPFAAEQMLPTSESIENGMRELGVEGIHEAQIATYKGVRTVFFTMFTVLFGFVLSLLWGIVSALLEFLGTFVLAPIARVVTYLLVQQIRPLVQACLEPLVLVVSAICKATGAYFSSIAVKFSNTKDPVSEAERAPLV